MNKNRFNLRKVATMVACLAVTTIFATCGKSSSNDDEGSGGNGGKGKIDAELLGSWFVGDVTGLYYDAVTGRYTGEVAGGGTLRTFKNDGTCTWFSIVGITSEVVRTFSTAKYSAENGVIKTTNEVLETSYDKGKTWTKSNITGMTSYYLVVGTYLYWSEDYQPTTEKYQTQFRK